MSGTAQTASTTRTLIGSRLFATTLRPNHLPKQTDFGTLTITRCCYQSVRHLCNTTAALGRVPHRNIDIPIKCRKCSLPLSSRIYNQSQNDAFRDSNHEINALEVSFDVSVLGQSKRLTTQIEDHLYFYFNEKRDCLPTYSTLFQAQALDEQYGDDRRPVSENRCILSCYRHSILFSTGCT